MEDNLYQRSSERLITPPQAQTDRLQKAKMEYEREKPILSKLLKRLHEQVDFYSRVDSIDCTSNSEQFMHEVRANKRVVAILRSEINAIERLGKMFDK